MYLSTFWGGPNPIRGGQTPKTQCNSNPGPDVRLQNVFNFRRADAAARDVIGPLTETRRRTINACRLRRSVCVVIALRERGTIISI